MLLYCRIFSWIYDQHCISMEYVENTFNNPIQSVEDAAHPSSWHETWYSKYDRWDSDMWSKVHPFHICCTMKKLIEESRPGKEPLKWDVGDFHGIECPTVEKEKLACWMQACSKVLAEKKVLTPEEWALKQDLDDLRKRAKELHDESNKSWFLQHFLKVFCRGTQTPEGMIHAVACVANPPLLL